MQDVHSAWVGVLTRHRAALAHPLGPPWPRRLHHGRRSGRSGLGIRVRAQKMHLGVDGQAGVHFITTAVPMLNITEVVRLIATIETLGTPPAAIIWDTLSRTFIGGDENSSKDMAAYVAAIDRVKEAVGGTAIVQHHTGHGSRDRERGSSVLRGTTILFHSLSSHAFSLPSPYSNSLRAPCLTYVGREGVVYIMGEGRGRLGIRVRAQKMHLGVDGQAGVHFITTAVPMLNITEVVRLIATIETLGTPPAAIIWDTLSRTFIGGDENSSKDMAAYVAAIDRVKEAVGGTAIVQHHTGHGSRDRERGSSVLGGAADTIMSLDDKDGVLELACEKQKDASEFPPILLKLHPVGESCVLKLHDGAWSNAGFLSQVEREALRSLHESFLDDGGSATAWKDASGMAPSSFYKARTSLVRRHLVDQEGAGKGARYVMQSEGLRLLKLHTSTVTP